MASRAIDLLITYRVVKMLVTPFNKTEAFKRGIIDKDGKVLKKSKTLKDLKDKKAYTILHRFVFNLKRIIKKVGLGSRLGSFGVALALLLKEDSSYSKHKPQIEQAVIKWLKETGEYENLLNECKDIPNISAFPIMTCFGMDIYERGNELVSEQDYGREANI